MSALQEQVATGSCLFAGGSAQPYGSNVWGYFVRYKAANKYNESNKSGEKKKPDLVPLDR